MQRRILALFALATVTLSGCSDDGSPDEGANEKFPIELSETSVKAFVDAAAGDRLECFDIESPMSFTTCLSDNAYSAHLYVFYDDEGAPERVYVANDSDATLSELTIALRETLLSDVPKQDAESAITSDEVTKFDGAVVKGGSEYVVIATDESVASEPFPELPTVDGDAIATSLQQNFGATCETQTKKQTCESGDTEVMIGLVNGEGSPVTMSAQVDVLQEGEFFTNVPEFLAAAGMPISAEAKEMLATCMTEQHPCTPRLITEGGLLVDMMGNIDFTLVEVTGLPSFD